MDQTSNYFDTYVRSLHLEISEHEKLTGSTQYPNTAIHNEIHCDRHEESVSIYVGFIFIDTVVKHD